MIKEHSHDAFIKVPDDAILWQYMSLAKFINLIRTKTLYLRRLDSFRDSKEGVLTTIDSNYFPMINIPLDYMERERKRIFVNCWIESPHELALMWETYGKGGVVIKTTAHRLRACMSSDQEHKLYLIKIRYIDPETDSCQDIGKELNALKIAVVKRKYYKQEQEVRLLYSTQEVQEDMKEITIPLDTEVLIDKVIVYPNAEKYFLDTINSLLRENGISITAVNSEI